MIPVYRDRYDRQSINSTLTVLKKGFPLLIAPEGGRSRVPGLRRAQPGVAYLMDKARVPVVPVGVIGSTDGFLKRGLRGERPEIKMNIGKPLDLPRVEGRGSDRREARQQNAEKGTVHSAATNPSGDTWKNWPRM